MEPRWNGGDNFIQQIQRCILHPFKHPAAYFDKELLPVRRLIAVFGSVTSNKGNAIESFCEQNQVPVCTVDALPQYQDSLSKLTSTESARDCVLLIYNACSLYHEVASEEASRWVIQLPEYAEARNIIVVACCHRLLRPQQHQASAYRAAVASMFSRARLYFPPPNSSARFALVQWWAQQLTHRFKHVSVSLSDDELQSLSSLYMDMCSAGDVRSVLQNVWYNENTIDYVTITSAPYVVNNHVMPENLQPIENMYSEYVGQGPISARPAKRARQEAPQEPPLVE